MKDLTIRLVKNKDEFKDVLDIRNKVFVIEQMVPPSLETDEFEDISKHVIALYNNKPIGCGRIRPIGNKIKLERLAVLKNYRSKGIGRQLMNFMIDYAKKQKPEEIFMHAQHYLKDFYEKFGFRTRGEVFDEAGMPHIEMYTT